MIRTRTLNDPLKKYIWSLRLEEAPVHNFSSKMLFEKILEPPQEHSCGGCILNTELQCTQDATMDNFFGISQNISE